LPAQLAGRPDIRTIFLSPDRQFSRESRGRRDPGYLCGLCTHPHQVLAADGCPGWGWSGRV